MIHNYFWVMHITVEKIVRGNTQPAHDVPRISPKGPSHWDLQGTFRGLLGDQFKDCRFYENNYFSDVIALLLHICFWFLHEEKIFKNPKRERPRDIYGTQLRDIPGTNWWDILGTCVGRRSTMFFKFNSQTH